jgi:hypothetical protein
MLEASALPLGLESGYTVAVGMRSSYFPLTPIVRNGKIARKPAFIG